ncbi:hypothetical protein [Microbacterium elymi]|uniref:Integral membrane protein n=1 Tax=Microbacterium elymi TaxID=2909587 RepID=A0ABY5NKY8_9MICO|nr:hypothetical protein [Microbacterium elymi]UUT35848.1 hypothetical protein L2X98_22000 [Microbacterium elymi]
MDPIIAIVVGVTVLTVIGIESGGVFLLRVVSRGLEFNALQKSFFRAGHAHAGVLVILGIVCLLLQAAAGVTGGWEWAGVGVLAAALLVPGGFFLSVLGSDPKRPGRAIALLWTGVAVLAVSLAVTGVSVIVAGVAALG